MHLAGNLMIDSLGASVSRASQLGILARLGAAKKSYGLVTLHRPSNADDPEHFTELVETLSIIAREIALYFPVHPRTRAHVEAQKTALHPAMHLTDPLGYLDFLWLMSAALSC